MLNAFLTIGIFQLVTMAVLLVRTKALALLLGPDGVGVLAIVDKLLATVGQALVLTLASIAGVWVGGLSTFYILYALVGMVLVIFTIVFVERKPAGAIGSKRLPFFQLKLPRKIWNFSLAVWALAFITPFAA